MKVIWFLVGVCAAFAFGLGVRGLIEADMPLEKISVMAVVIGLAGIPYIFASAPTLLK